MPYNTQRPVDDSDLSLGELFIPVSERKNCDSLPFVNVESYIYGLNAVRFIPNHGYTTTHYEVFYYYVGFTVSRLIA